jgi:hypothetical protein
MCDAVAHETSADFGVVPDRPPSAVSRRALSTKDSPQPDEPDVHLCVCLHGMHFHFAACLTAALMFVQEHRHRHYVDDVGVLPGDTEGLPRMTNERLFLER